ncbi:MAG: hypothetical protein ACYTF7_05660 [Planctomycetota bacterium]|jgi:hypothetical protein
MTDPSHNNTRSDLHDVIEALVESSYSTPDVDPSLRSQAAKLNDILSLLDPPADKAAPDQSLVDTTLLRCLASREISSTLTADDARSLDALVEHNWDQSDVPAGYRQRSSRIARILSALDPPDDVTEQTIAEQTWNRVRTHAATSANTELFEINTLRTGGLPLRELGAIAAMVIGAFSLLFPTLGAAHHRAQQHSCVASLANAGVGFAMFARDNNGRLPTTQHAAEQGQLWWNVGTPQQSHSADLFTLSRLGYTQLHDLACAGNHRAVVNLDTSENHDWRAIEEVSYSYQLFPETFRAVRFVVPSQTVILADRSPLVIRSQLGEYVSAEARSMNHSGTGQNILAADRSVQWLDSPVIQRGNLRDNIWLPASLEHLEIVRLTGTETPEIWGDVFVGP